MGENSAGFYCVTSAAPDDGLAFFPGLVSSLCRCSSPVAANLLFSITAFLNQILSTSASLRCSFLPPALFFVLPSNSIIIITSCCYAGQMMCKAAMTIESFIKMSFMKMSFINDSNYLIKKNCTRLLLSLAKWNKRGKSMKKTIIRTRFSGQRVTCVF